MKNLHIILLGFNLIYYLGFLIKYIFVSNENSDTVVVLDKLSKKLLKL